MKTGICNLPLVPLRAQPSEQSEMVSQMLFGELFELLEEQEGWYKIRICSDSYVGWSTSKMLQLLPAALWNELSESKPYVTTPVLSVCMTEHSDTNLLYLPAGSRLYETDVAKGSFAVYRTTKPDVPETERELWLTEIPLYYSDEPVKLAMHFMNAPYLWGGKSVFGIDCSGLVQVIFSMLGYSLPRDAKDQVCEGVEVLGIKEAVPGDLAFFANTSGKIVHVGIISGKDQIIHASGSVHIDHLDEKGIFSDILGRYTHQLCNIRRILP